MSHQHEWDQDEIETYVREQGGLREVYRIKHPACRCGERRPTKRGGPRPPFERYIESSGDGVPPRTETNLAVAQRLLRYKEDDVPWRGRRTQLINDHTDKELEQALHQLAGAGWVRIVERRKGDLWQPHRIHVLDVDGLEDHARPGQREALRASIDGALSRIPDTEAGTLLHDHLVQGAPGWEPETVEWAAALVALDARRGRALVRQFSAWKGRPSKSFEKHRMRVERVLGDVAELGIVGSDSRLQVAGSGDLVFPDHTLPVTPRWGIIELERRRLRELSRVIGDPIVFIENEAVFEAVTMGIVPELKGGLFVFTHGNVGSTMRHVASVSEGPILVWADVDPEGARIARVLWEASDKRARPYRMGPDELDVGAQELEPERLQTAEQELKREGPLTELLQRIVREGIWREQENQLPPPVEE